MNIGDLYDRDGLKGVIVSIDNSGTSGLIMSLDEAHMAWNDANKWCEQLGNGWFMPSLKDFETMKNDDNLNKIQNTLIRVGMPLCMGDKISEGTNKHGHMYWTSELESGEFYYVFCLDYGKFSSISSDSQSSKYVYIRAMHKL